MQLLIPAPDSAPSTRAGFRSQRATAFRRWGRALACLSLVVGAASFAPQAAAEPNDAEVAAARAMFAEARSLEDGQKWAEARARLEAVAAVRMTPQVRFHIALCDEHLGRLVSAFNGFQQAKTEAAPARLKQVVKESEEHIAALKPRIPDLQVLLPPGAESATVLVDGQSVAVALLAVPLPLDPGAHRIVVQAPGRLEFLQEVSLEEGSHSTLQVVLDAAPPAAEPPPAAAHSAPAPAASASPPPQAPKPPPAPPPPQPQTSNTAGWILVAVGGVALTGAGVAALVRSSAISDIDAQCPSHTDCDPALESTHDRAQTSGIIAGSLGIAGAVTLAAGGYLLLLPSADSSSTAGPILSPAVSPQGASISGVVRW